MHNLVRQARRRLFGNELLSEGANAFSAALVAFIILLLLGTEILDWRWVLPIPAVAAGVGFYRARRRLPSAYGVAQSVDKRLSLDDTLSTAWYFSAEGSAPQASPGIRHYQFRLAEDRKSVV